MPGVVTKTLDSFVALRKLNDDGHTEAVEIVSKDKLPAGARKTGRKCGGKIPLSEYIIGSQKAVDAYYGIVEKFDKTEKIKKNGRNDFKPFQPRRGG